MLSTLICLMTLADPSTYLKPITEAMEQKWPGNRTINIVCHGHSVPSGYFVTPVVDTFNSYPHLLHVAIKKKFPHAVVNVIVTAIGGENSVSGAARFEKDVMALRPDVVLIDYSLNDRGVGLEKAREAWVAMVKAAKAKGAKVLLLTPTPDLSEKILDSATPLAAHSAQVRKIAEEEGVGLVDSYARFKQIAGTEPLAPYMSQGNHPNRKGHDVVVSEAMKFF